MADTLWIGQADDKLYLQSGQFSSTLKTSLAIGAVEVIPQGISWDGTNTPWSGTTGDKLYLQSGQFSSTLKTSRDISGIDNNPQGISWNGTDTPWTGRQGGGNKLYLQSGQFSSTLKKSLDVGGVDAAINSTEYGDFNARVGAVVDDLSWLGGGTILPPTEEIEVLAY